MAQKRLVHDPWGDLPEFGQDPKPTQDEFADVPDLDQPEIQPTETPSFTFPTLEAAPEVQPEPAAPPPPIDAPGFFGRQIELFGEGTKQVGRSLLGMGALLGEAGEPLPGQDIIAQTIPEAGLSGLDVNFGKFMRDLQTKIAPDPTIAPPQNIWEEFVINVPQIVGQIGTTVAAGPVAGGLYMIGQIGGSKYTQLTDQGVDKDRAAAFAMADAIIQTPLELIGIGKVLKVWKPQQLLSKKLKALAVAMGTEAFTEWMQKFPEEITSHIALNPDDPNNKMVTDILAQLPDWAWEGLQHEAPVGALMGAFFGSPGAFYGVKKQHDAEIYRKARDRQVESVIRGTELSESDRQLAQSGLMDQIEQFHRDNDAEARTHPDLMQQIEEFRRQMALEKPPDNLIEKIEDFQREQGNFIRPPLMQELFDFRQKLIQRAKLPEDVAAFQAEQEAARKETPEVTLAADIEKFQTGRAVAEAEPAVAPPTEAEVGRQAKAARDEAATAVETAIDEGRPAEEVQALITAYEQAAGDVAPDRGLVAKIKDFQKGQGLPEQVARFNRQRAIIRNTIRKNPDASIGEVFREVKKKAPESQPVRQEIAKVVKEEKAEFETVAVATDAESKEILAEMDRKGVEPPSEATTKSEGHQGFIGFWEYYKGEDGTLFRSPVDSELAEGRRTNAERLASPDRADAFFKKAKSVLTAKPKAKKKPSAAETLAALEKPKPKFKVEEKKAVEIAKATSRSTGAVGPQAVIPRIISKLIARGQKVLDFGAGKDALHAKSLKKSGFNVKAYDFNLPGSEKLLDTKHDVVYASNVLNVQADDTMLNLTKGQLHQAVKSDGVVYANFPSSPNIINMTPKMMEKSLGTHFEVRRLPAKELADLGVGKGNVVFELTPKKLTPKFKAEQKKLQTKQTRVNEYRELLEKAFPFAKVIQPVPKKPSQFAVKMPNGATIIVQTNDQISPDLEAFEAAYQKPFDPETMTILGKWTPAQNARITGQGMISLAKESQDVIDHETFHAAVAMVLTPREMAMLQKKYGTEEDAANAYANWSPSESNTIFQKIKDFFEKVLEAFKIRPPALTAAQVFAKIKKGHVWDRALMEQLPVGGRFGIQLDKSGNVTWNTDLIASGMGYAIEEGATEVGVVTPGRGGKFIRGSKKNKGKDAARTVAKTANNNVVVESWDGAATLAEAADYAENQMVFIEPTLVEDKKTVRWQDNKLGHYGNEKMEFPNATYPLGRNTFDFQGCGRKAFMEINGLSGLTHPNGYTSEKACYGGACYAEAILRAKGGVNASIAGNVMVQGSNKRVKEMREEITQYTVENGVEAARAKFPDFQINWFGDTFKVQKQNPKTKAYRTVKNFDSDVAAREFLDKQTEGEYRLEVVEGKGTTVGEIISTLGGAKVTTNLGKAEGMDIRLGVDTDGSAWLARKDVMDALLETGANSFSIYSAGYHTPPGPHPLSRKTMINVTVSGYHPLAETMKRLEWARVARANGWNVILREVTADSSVFENAEVNLYNRLHEAFLATDFFMMEQPLHKGQAVSAPGVTEFGLPGCCEGSKQNPRTCDQCEVAEGQGKKFKDYWGIVEGEGEAKLLPDKQEGLQRIRPVEKYAVEEAGGPDIVEQGLDDIFASQHKGLGQRIKAAWKRTNLRTQIFDEFAPIKKWLGDRAYTLHRLLNGVNASMEAFMKHGRLVFESDGFLSVDNAHKGFAVWAKDKGKDAVNVLRWAAAKRSEQLERDLPGFAEMEGFLTADMRAKIREEIGPAPEGGGTWESLFKEFDEYHQSILDIAEQSGVISKKLRSDWDGLVYVPFYRVFEDPVTREEYMRNPGKAKNIATKLKKIKGSKKRIAEPIENVVSNWGYLLQESMRNNARAEAYFIANQMNKDMGVEVVTEIPESEIEMSGQDKRGVITYATKGGDDYVLSFLNKGHRQYFKVHDADLYNALTTVNADGFGKLFNVVFGTPKRLLTYGATFTPAFRIANALRDTLHTWMITPGMTFKPFIDSAVGFVSSMREDDNYMQALAAGGLHGGSYVHAGDQKSMARLTKQLLKDHKGATILDTPRKILEFWDRIGAASENAARVQLYKKLRGEGEGGLEAAFEARDLLDFSLKGQANIVQALTRMIPFFGARLQGNYRLGRAAMDNKIAFATKGLVLATASLGLWALYKDDEEYKALEDWQKWTYYYFKIGDQKFFIPKPFEVGAIFSSAIQSAADVHAGNEDMGFLADFMIHTATETFAFNPIPQAALPLVEQWGNRSYFTGRPIEGFHLKNLKPGERAEHYTSETLQVLGRKWGIPPKRAEALILGYFSNVGATILMGTDQVARWFGDFPEKPTLRPQDYRMSFGRFWSQGPARNTKYMTRFYDMAEESNELIQTVKHLMATGRIDEARELRAANTGKMRLSKAFTTMKKRLSKIRKIEKKVHRSTQLTAEQKREKIEALSVRRNTIAKRAYDLWQRVLVVDSD